MRRPPKATRSAPLFPYQALCRSPIVEAGNKLDRVDEDRVAALVVEADRRDDVVALAALTGEGLERLITAVADRLTAAARVHRIQLSSSDGEDRKSTRLNSSH